MIVPLALIGADDAEELAALHATAFDRPWDIDAIADLLASPGVFAVGDVERRGFALIRVAADEAELLTIAVAPGERHQGLGRRLVETAAQMAAAQGAANLFLEVAADNAPALALYAALGFAPAGCRAGYYPGPEAEPIDALVLKKPLFTRA